MRRKLHAARGAFINPPCEGVNTISTGKRNHHHPRTLSISLSVEKRISWRWPGEKTHGGIGGGLCEETRESGGSSRISRPAAYQRKSQTLSLAKRRSSALLKAKLWRIERRRTSSVSVAEGETPHLGETGWRCEMALRSAQSNEKGVAVNINRIAVLCKL